MRPTTCAASTPRGGFLENLYIQWSVSEQERPLDAMKASKGYSGAPSITWMLRKPSNSRSVHRMHKQSNFIDMRSLSGGQWLK
ncbi:hypothetical protein PGTUg99_000047, partial [Puccinia graminis f. sp. tritici]